MYEASALETRQHSLIEVSGADRLPCAMLLLVATTQRHVHGGFRALLLVRLMREVRALGDNLICEAPPIQRLSKFLEQYGAAPSEELCGATEARPATDLQVEHALDDGVELDHRVVHKNPCGRQRSVLTASLGGCSETWLPMVGDKLREIFSECVEKLITDALQVVRQEHVKASLGVVSLSAC